MKRAVRKKVQKTRSKGCKRETHAKFETPSLQVQLTSRTVKMSMMLSHTGKNIDKGWPIIHPRQTRKGMTKRAI